MIVVAIGVVVIEVLMGNGRTRKGDAVKRSPYLIKVTI